MQTKITTFSPYTADPTPRSIFNGILASSYVNVNAFESDGNVIIIEQSVFAYNFKSKDRSKVKNLSLSPVIP
ncbi:hypothetical protein DPMN_088395 [Dreissena polymorpha]|uniref:Uncharacterized protein n=1 Tax=Dreissena polymorpha TaxID=45954 RepID=A0A9D4KW45_DREPO|nr:hypothetical protein DPMN_088395 [Dreissena polymorpha]